MATPNQQEALERFGEMVLSNPALHHQLRGAPDEAAFIDLAIRVGAEHGCELTPMALKEAIVQKRRAWLERWL